MEKLISELRDKIRLMSEIVDPKYNFSAEFLDNLYSVYPFNKFEFVISHLLGTATISLQQYLNMRNEYLDRNKYLYLFEITSPRKFGETWAQRHLNELVPELNRPSTNYDPNYTGQYDFWYNGIRIEVKASRAVDRDSDEILVIKALSANSKRGFDMNFQQLKPDCCDVFVWIGVWRDVIRYWVLSSDEVLNNRHYSRGQHRGNIGEGQLWIKETNIDEFAEYEVSVREIFNKILIKGVKF